MKKFRGKEVIGWVGVEAATLDGLMKKTNKLMDEFDFIDTQYSSHSNFNNILEKYYSMYSVILLLAKKED